MHNSQRVCTWIKKYGNDNFRSNQQLKKIRLYILRSVKIWDFNQKYLKFTYFT